MSARMNYISVPVDYVRALKTKGVRGRERARAFMEYFDDLDSGDHHSVGFYAESWGVSKSTAHDWLKEFRHEKDRFFNFWVIKNGQHYSYAKNQTERTERQQPNEPTAEESQKIGVYKYTTERTERQQPNEVFNINVVDSAGARASMYDCITDPEFSDLCFTYSMNGGTVGKKPDAYEVYKTIHADPDSLKIAAMEYLHTSQHKGHYNLKNFMMNDAYMKYMPKRVSIMHQGQWVDMDYDIETGTLRTDNGSTGSITPKMMIKMFKDGELKFIKPTGRAA